MTLSYKKNVFKVVVEDDGISFNPLDIEAPNLDQSLSDTAIGGLGIHFVKSLTDDLTYRRKGDKNIVTMTIKVTNNE